MKRIRPNKTNWLKGTRQLTLRRKGGTRNRKRCFHNTRRHCPVVFTYTEVISVGTSSFLQKWAGSAQAYFDTLPPQSRKELKQRWYARKAAMQTDNLLPQSA